MTNILTFLATWRCKTPTPPGLQWRRRRRS